MIRIEHSFWEKRKFDLVFYICVFLLALPFLLLPAFPTLDGPAHVYNANLLREWFTGDQAFLSRYFNLNTFINPNLTSHLFLTLLGSFLEPSQCEKVLVLLCVISIPLSFRYFTLGLLDRINWFTFLILPFAYSFLLMMGFFNFCLAISVFFLAYGYWIRNRKSRSSIHKGIMLFLLLACYLSHLFVFLLLAGILVAHEVLHWWKVRSSKKGIGSILLLLLPLLTFSLWFLLRQPQVNIGGLPDPMQIAGWLWNAQSIIGLNEGYEQVFTRCITILSMLLLGGIFFRWKKSNGEDDAEVSVVKSLLLLVSLGMLFLSFLFPDWMFGGGYLSLRLNFLFFIFLFASLSLYYKGAGLGIACFLIITITTAVRVKYYTSESRMHAQDVPELQALADHLPPYSSVLPLVYSPDWFQGHFSNYIGKTGKVIIFENYEAETHYFPLQWETGQNPKEHLWDLIHLNPCGDYKAYHKVTGMNIDCILVWKYNEASDDSCAKDLLRRVREDYDTLKVSYNGNGTIFKKKAL